MDIIDKVLIKISVLFYKIIAKNRFLHLGSNVFINRPLQISGIQNISIGNNAQIHYRTWLAATSLNNTSCELIIGDGSIIGHFNHIYATKKIILGKKVLTADKVYISDNLHGYENVMIPIMDQPVKQIGEVHIGDGTWIGENAVILGASIGKNCVIGANAVVTKNIPDFCVVVGVPGKIIKRYNEQQHCWMKTNESGEFITP